MQFQTLILQVAVAAVYVTAASLIGRPSYSIASRDTHRDASAIPSIQQCKTLDSDAITDVNNKSKYTPMNTLSAANRFSSQDYGVTPDTNGFGYVYLKASSTASLVNVFSFSIQGRPSDKVMFWLAKDAACQVPGAFLDTLDFGSSQTYKKL
jgi:hypothetical protein